MRARDDLLARVAALLHAVGVQAFERELLRRPFLDLRLRKSRQAMGKVERRPAGARIEVVGGRQSRPGPKRACAAVAAEIKREAVGRHRRARAVGGRMRLERTAYLQFTGFVRHLAADPETSQLPGDRSDGRQEGEKG